MSVPLFENRESIGVAQRGYLSYETSSGKGRETEAVFERYLKRAGTQLDPSNDSTA